MRITRYRKILPPMKWYGRVYYPMSVARTKKEATDFVEKSKKFGEYYLRIVAWPKNVSTEEYGSGPGYHGEPEWVVYAAKRGAKRRKKS